MSVFGAPEDKVRQEIMKEEEEKEKAEEKRKKKRRGEITQSKGIKHGTMQNTEKHDHAEKRVDLARKK